MKKPKLRELKEALRSLMAKPYTSKFPFAPHTPEKNFRGAPRYSEEGCICCTGCGNVCPPNAIEFIDDLSKSPPTRAMVVHHDICIFCGQCQKYCTTREDTPPGITLGNEFDLATFDRKEAISRVEKELVLCEACGGPVTAKAHLEWIQKRLGVLAFSSPTLFMAHLGELGQIDESISGMVSDLTRGDRMKILCAACRRKTTLEK